MFEPLLIMNREVSRRSLIYFLPRFSSLSTRSSGTERGLKGKASRSRRLRFRQSDNTFQNQKKVVELNVARVAYKDAGESRARFLSSVGSFRSPVLRT